MRKLISGVLLSSAILGAGASSTYADTTRPVIEVATFKLKPGVSYQEFAPIDQAVKDQHVSKQAGYLSRESGAGENGEWGVIVHWQSAADADASMKSFMSAKAAQSFMLKVDASTMVMKRYQAPEL